MYKNLPLYEAGLAEDICGIQSIALVANPATESQMLLFNTQKRMYQFSEEKRLAVAPVMRANFPIYRIDEYGKPFYVQYSPEVLREISQRFIESGSINSVNIEHTNNYVEGLKVQELFIKDTSKGISPKGFEEVEDGSLFIVYKVLNDDIWNRMKSGEWFGISLEGLFSIEIPEPSKIDTINDLLKQLENED